MAKIENSVARMQSISALIKENALKIDTVKHHVVMLSELWNLYFDEGKVHLCQNVLNYCKIKNAFDSKKNSVDPVLLVSLMDSDQNCFPYAYFKNGVIEFIKR